MGKTATNKFAGLPPDFTSYHKAKTVILPVPFEKTTTWLKGTNKGPKAIIEASKNMELYDTETASEVYKLGIHTGQAIHAKNSVEMINKVYRRTNKYLSANKFIVTLGGEHSISIGSIKSHLAFFDNLSILHLDAHSDRRNSFRGSIYNHACVLARVQEMTDKVISVGIRSVDSTELDNINPSKIFYAEKIYGSSNWQQQVIKKLTKNIYITIDLDVFDPGIMSSVGTPEPGGLDWYSVLELLHRATKEKNIVGFDVVELCPSPHNKAPDFLAAKLIYKLLSYKFCG